MATPVANKASAHRWFDEVWNQQRPETIYEMLRPDGIAHTEQGEFVGPDAFAGLHAAVLAGIPDIRFTIEDSVAEGDHVVVRWLAEGTHRGPFLGVEATGRPLRSRGMTWQRFEDGLLAEGWDSWDLAAVMQQITQPAVEVAG